MPWKINGPDTFDCCVEQQESNEMDWGRIDNGVHITHQVLFEKGNREEWNLSSVKELAIYHGLGVRVLNFTFQRLWYLKACLD